MKKILGFVLIVCAFVIGSKNISALSEYDFIEYDVATKQTTTVSYEDRDLSDIPDKTDANDLLISTRGIIGDDNREAVEDTTEFPYSAIVKVTVKFVGVPGSAVVH